MSRNERSNISGMNARGLKAVVAGILSSGMKDVTIASHEWKLARLIDYSSDGRHPTR